jgi:hypothetical protein
VGAIVLIIPLALLLWEFARDNPFSIDLCEFVIKGLEAGKCDTGKPILETAVLILE